MILQTKNYRLKALITGLIVAFCSMFYVNFFVDDFIITISVVVLPILLYLYNDRHPLTACLVTAIVSPAFRGITLALKGYSPTYAFRAIIPEVFFYLVYGLVFYSVFYKHKHHLGQLIVAIMSSDFLANYTEMAIRLQGYHRIPFDIIRGLLMIAAARTLVATLFIVLIKHISLLILKEENEQNYQKLMLLTAGFWSEIYFLEKNINYIEDLMAKAFNLYQYAEANAKDREIVIKSLEVAREVHEVKKDYIRVIQGLESFTESKLSNIYIGVNEVIDIITENSKKLYAHHVPAIEINSEVQTKVKVRYHFYMTSVIQNLVSNAIEAIPNNRDGRIKIRAHQQGDDVFIIVSDNGTGIKKRDLDFIFKPGFSSKYNANSGDVKRGLGLNIVKNIVEDEFKGTIEVDSHEDSGTTFTLKFNRAQLEGEDS